MGLFQLWALFYKRLFHHVRDFRSYLSQLFLPAAFICLAMGVSLLYPNSSNMGERLLTPDLYEEKSMFYRLESISYKNKFMRAM